MRTGGRAWVTWRGRKQAGNGLGLFDASNLAARRRVSLAALGRRWIAGDLIEQSVTSSSHGGSSG
jgi:hypothetical protein